MFSPGATVVMVSVSVKVHVLSNNRRGNCGTKEVNGGERMASRITLHYLKTYRKVGSNFVIPSLFF